MGLGCVLSYALNQTTHPLVPVKITNVTQLKFKMAYHSDRFDER